jgi:predicted Zn-dependent protease
MIHVFCTHWVRSAALVLLFAAACLPLLLASPVEAEEPYGIFSFDGAGPALVPDDREHTASELVIQGFGGDVMSVRWATGTIVPFCAVQAGRAAAVSQDQFDGAIRQALDMWNQVEASVGLRFVGDCAAARVTMGNRVNEIGWDDAWDAVTGSQAAVTQGVWLASFGRRDFIEADILIEGSLTIPQQCLSTVIAHEIGHAIGFGHSDSTGDLMAPSFNANDLSTCRPTASPSEASWLSTLYGINRKPTLMKPLDVSVEPGAAVMLTAAVADPEGGPVTVEWRQVAGPAVNLVPAGVSTSFNAPASGPVTIEVVAVDRLGKRAVAPVVVTVSPATLLAAGIPPAVPAGSLGFRESVSASGVTLVRWAGGTVESALATSGVHVRSVWSLQGGVPIGYIAGAPEFVNQPFLATVPGGAIQTDTYLVVVTSS